MESKVLEAYAYSSPLGTPTVSIDLGTSRSAMAVTFVGNELYSQELILPSRCGSRPSDQGKIQTAILLQPRFERFRASTVITSPNDVEVVAFGDEAERQYADMPAEERNGYIFCKWFKMMLHQTNVNPDPIIEADPNARFTVTLSVAIAKSIEVFRDAAMQHLRRTHKADVKESDIIWVLTVPAIWR
jgi:molecular chaperone DnaK (HSP70)